MTETPRDPFAPDPTPNPAPDPVPPPYDPPPVEPPTPVDPPEPAEPVEPVTPPDPITPPQPITPEPISPPDPVDPPAPLEVPLPLSSRAEAAPLAPENAGDAEVVSAEEPAPLEPAEPEAPQPEAPQPEPGADAALPLAAAGTENPPGTENRPVEAAAPRRTWLPVAAVTLAVLLLAGATGWLGWQVRQQSVAEDGRPDAIAAARDAARLLFSYDHATLEEDFAKGLAVTTGEFRSEYSRTTKEVVTPVAQQYKAVVVAEVVEASIVEEGPGRATALVFLNQGTTSTRVQGQQVDQSRVRMQLVERDGRWLVRAVDAL